jgi:regulator of protease activity HflC (stomatin/prohibitin superfamily)
MNPYAIFLLVLFGMFVAAVWLIFAGNKFSVEPNKRERLVVQNFINGTMRMLEPGAHFLPPWWDTLERVDLNREPMSVKDDEIRTADGVLAEDSYRFDLIVGRNYNKTTGQLEDPDDPRRPADPDGDHMVKEEPVLWAVSRIDFKTRQARVQEIVKGSVEEELGSHTLQQLLTPGRAGGLLLPALQIAGITVCKAKRAKTSAELLTGLAERVEARANKKLTFVGINVTGFQFTNLKAKNLATQDALEKKVENRYAADAARLMMNRAAAAGSPITFNEATASDNPESLGAVVQGEATKSIAVAIREGSRALGEGMRHWGRG